MVWGLGFAAFVLAVAGLAVYRQQSATSLGGGTPADLRRPRHVVLVTVDTLRADRVGAYGWKDARTPAIDGLAARGARFDRAFAAAPITLPSHASLLSGLYPPGHGSRHNGMRVRDGVATLATVLREQGWATGAFVGAFPLDRRFGLDRGFLRYGDRMSRTDEGRVLNERPGRVVVDEALEWARSMTADRRMFLWVHLFEPHAPYEPDPQRGPGGWSLPPAVRYDDEVARADREIVRLLAGLAERAASTLVVVAGDHGEAFGEHGEISHSLFVYDTTLRVPLILAGPGIPPLSPPVSAPVSLVDVLPTVLDLCGLPRRDTDGVSLVPTLQGRPIDRRELYAESFAPLLDFGWSSLRAVRSGSLKYIESPQPELFDVDRDPSEEHNLAGSRREEAQRLAARVENWSGAELPTEQALSGMDAGVRARLNALGYVSGTTGSAASGIRPDPKDRRELAARLALVFSGELNGSDLRRALQKLADEDPRNTQVRTRLGYSLIDAGDVRAAEPHFRAAIAASMPSVDAHLGLALCLSSTGRAAEAERVLIEAKRVEPGNPVVEANLGSLALEANRLDAAIAHFGAALDRDSDLHQARFNLARALAKAGRRTDAAKQARELLTRLPAGAPQRAEVERLLTALQ